MELLESDSARPKHWSLWKRWKEWKEWMAQKQRCEQRKPVQSTPSSRLPRKQML